MSLVCGWGAGEGEGEGENTRRFCLEIVTHTFTEQESKDSTPVRGALYEPVSTIRRG